MKIETLEIRDIKGIRHIKIIAGPVVELAGKNGAGKSAVLDSIVFALCGARAIDDKPIRDGAAKGEITLETSDGMRVELKLSSGRNKIKITAQNGARMGQRELDKIFGGFTFDPLEFSRKRPLEQVEYLKQIADGALIEMLDQIDEMIPELETGRTRANREVKDFGEQPEPPKAGRADVSALTKQLCDAVEHNAKAERKERARHELEYDIADAVERMDRLKREIEQSHKELADLGDPLTMTETQPIRDELDSATERNSAADLHDRWQETCAAKEEAIESARAAQRAVEDMRAKRIELMSRIELPLDGADLTDDGLLIHGIPFDQMSSAERIEVSARIGMASDAKLKVMLIREGSLLDDATFARLIALAQECEYQLWIETVGDGHGDAIEIVEGEVKQ